MPKRLPKITPEQMREFPVFDAMFAVGLSGLLMRSARSELLERELLKAKRVLERVHPALTGEKYRVWREEVESSIRSIADLFDTIAKKEARELREKADA